MTCGGSLVYNFGNPILVVDQQSSIKMLRLIVILILATRLPPLKLILISILMALLV